MITGTTSEPQYVVYQRLCVYCIYSENSLICNGHSYTRHADLLEVHVAFT